MNNFYRTAIINKFNLEIVMRDIDNFENVKIIKDHIENKYLDKLVDFLKYLGKNVEITDVDATENNFYMRITKYRNDSEIDTSSNYGKILQYIASFRDEGNDSYRRAKINKYFKENGWNPDTIYSNTDNKTYLKMLFDKKYDYILYFNKNNTIK